MLDDREGKRTGFELPVYRDILLLISIAHEIEKMSTIDGSKLNPRVRSQDEHPSTKNVENQKNDSNLDMIEFEVIDFPNVTSVKK